MLFFAIFALVVCIIALALNIKTENKVMAHIMVGCILINLANVVTILLNL